MLKNTGYEKKNDGSLPGTSGSEIIRGLLKAKGVSRLVYIISVVPHEAKPILLPKLKAKLIWTASGIAVAAVMCKPHRLRPDVDVRYPSPGGAAEAACRKIIWTIFSEFIYKTLVFGGAELYELWKTGRYKSSSFTNRLCRRMCAIRPCSNTRVLG
ncbi:hypothetical protein pipiens_010860 [Culex pipiens pipiens]|uniref:Uncharacterized protein n=1 Tax=Culex pipiens pipiens TaxID=38569 RepID=A0ABD1D8I6_CULPP